MLAGFSNELKLQFQLIPNRLYMFRKKFSPIVRHPQHTQTGSNSSTIAADSSNGVTIPDAVDAVVCAPDDGWKYHPEHVEQFPDINKLCYVSSC
jgi:hypothetical protein